MLNKIENILTICFDVKQNMSRSSILDTSCVQVRSLEEADLVTTEKGINYYSLLHDAKSITNFWEQYCFEVSEKNNGKDPSGKESGLFISEKVNDFTPLQISVDMTFQKSKEMDEMLWDKPYTNVFLITFVRAIQSVIKETYQISPSRQELICFVLEETEIDWEDHDDDNENGRTVQVRFCFPKCVVKKDDIYPIICKEVERNILASNINQFLRLTPNSSWKESLAGNKNPKYWPLYGSRAGPGARDIYAENCFPEIVEDYRDDRDPDTGDIDVSLLPEADIFDFSPSDHIDSIDGHLNMQLFDENGDYDYWLPLILSTRYYKTPLKRRVKKETNADLRRFEKVEIPSPEIDNDETLCYFFVSLLSRERFTQRHYWQKIGAAVFNCFEDKAEARRLFEEYTFRHGAFTSLDVKAIFSSFDVNNPYTVKTLGWLARVDDPEIFKNWHEKWVSHSVKVACQQRNELSVAEVFYRKYWFDFCCEKYRPLSLYYYHNHHWNQCDGGDKLLIKIIKPFRDFFNNIVKDNIGKMSQLIEGPEKDCLSKENQALSRLVCKLGTEAVMQKVSRFLHLLYKTDDFNIHRDMDSKLTCFQNGVLEVCGYQSYFRPGIPEDYITLTCSCKFNEDLTWESESVQFVMEMFKQVYHYDDMVDFMMRVYAYSGYLSFNTERKIFSHIGPKGANGKTTFKKLIEKTWGGYAFTTSASAFAETTGQGGSSAPSPHFVLARYCRYFFTQEAGRGQIWSDSKLKENSGNDTVYGRLMRENGGVYQQHFTLHAVNNHPQIIPHADKPIRDRMIFIPYDTVYEKQDYPESVKQQRKQRRYPMDPNLETRLSSLAPAFAWICRQGLHDYLKKGLDVPRRVIEFSREHWKQNDPFDLFIDDKLEPATYPDEQGVKVKDENSTLSIKNIHREFRNFFEEYFGGINFPMYSNVLTEFENRLGKMKNGFFSGWRYKEGGDFDSY